MDSLIKVFVIFIFIVWVKKKFLYFLVFTMLLALQVQAQLNILNSFGKCKAINSRICDFTVSMSALLSALLCFYPHRIYLTTFTLSLSLSSFFLEL